MQAMRATKESTETIPISEVMTRNPICVSPDESVSKVAGLLLEHGISGLPVINVLGHPIGIISKTDLIREGYGPGDGGAIALRRPGRTPPRAGDVMTRIAFTVQEGTPVSQAAALMVFEGVHRLPVVTASGAVVGIVSTIDVLRWMAEREGYLFSRRDIRRQIED